MDSQILQRREARARNAELVAKKAEDLRLQGNQLFLKKKYVEAAEKYIDALDVHGPRPMILSNLAACYNTLGLYGEAENVATTALEYDPAHVKARYRRAIARKHLCHFRAAMKDLNVVLSLEPSHQEARKEISLIEYMSQGNEDFSSPADDHPLVSAHPWELPEDSDSEDCRHVKSLPCAAYNHGSCQKGHICPFSHAPDTMSVRDEIGRNVCSKFLIRICNRGEGCHYSHSKTHLPLGGWWEDEKAITHAKKVKDWLDDEDVEYHELHPQLVKNPRASGYASRREWAELRLHIHSQYESVVEAQAIKKIKIPAPPEEKFVLVVSFDYHRETFDPDAALIGGVSREVKVVDTGKSSNGRGVDMTIQYLGSPNVVSVLLIDASVFTRPELAQVAQKLVTYAKNGGTVVMGGQLPSHIRPDDFDKAMKNTWGLHWKSGSYCRSTFQLNASHDIAKRTPSLVTSYSMKALHLANIQPKDALYAEIHGGKPREAPVVLSRLGQGFVGYIGDVNSEAASETVITAMLGVLGRQDGQQSKSSTPTASAPSALPSPPKTTFVLVISFDHHGLFEGIHAHLFSGMKEKVEVVHVRELAPGGKGPDLTLQFLESPYLRGVLVTDPDVITKNKYSKVAQKLVAYVQEGGRVVLGGQLVTNIRPNDLERAFKSLWGLAWKTGSYFRSTFHANPDNNVAKLNPSMSKQYSMKAVHVANISPAEAVYAATPASYTESAVFPSSKVKRSPRVEEAPVVSTNIGKGRFGFVGDVNCEEASTQTVMAILGILDELPKEEKKAEATQPTSSAQTDANPSAESNTDAFILVLALGGSATRLNPKLADQLGELSKKIHLKTAENSKEVLEYMAYPNLQGVYVIDKAIADRKNIAVLFNLNEFAQNGGLVVFGGSFPAEQPCPDEISGVFSKFGLPWEAGQHANCCAQLNDRHETAVRNQGLSADYMFTGLCLREFRQKDLLYDDAESVSEDWDAPILRARVGTGRVGYIGDISVAPESTQVLLSMFELLSPNKGGFDKSNKSLLLICDFDEEDLDVVAPEFIEATEAKVQVLVGPHGLTRSRMIELLASPKDLVGVMVGDGCLLFPENARLLSKLVDYTRSGGTVVFCWNFSTEMSARKQLMGMFFSRWNLQWEMVGPSPVEARFSANQSNVLFKDQKSTNVPPSFSMKGAVYIKGITEKMAAYVPVEQPKIWNPSRKIYTTPFVFAEVGKGRVGYVGCEDVDGELRGVIHGMFGLLEGCD